jgi:simple sugar transport system ATP-binding protein
VNLAIELKNISKSFNSVYFANDNINLKIKTGTVHALIGENGAGKSTLISILSGIIQPSGGSIFLDGKEVIINSPNIAKKFGIGTTHQHFKLIDNLSVLDNVILGNEGSAFIIDKQKIAIELNLILKKYAFDLTLNEKIAHLSVEAKQKVELLKIIYQKAEIIILDEPTAVLTLNEIDNLFKLIFFLKKEGKTVIFISHKLEEIKKIADEISVMKQGKILRTFRNENLDIKKLSILISGQELPVLQKSKYFSTDEEPILRLSNVSTGEDKFSNHIKLKNINFCINKGEIFALAGVENNGQNELIELIMGIKKKFQGTITFCNFSLNKFSIRQRYDEGISYIPGDRLKYAVMSNEKLCYNSVLQNIHCLPFSRYGIIDNEAIANHNNKLINNYKVEGHDLSSIEIGRLSGGNQQKFVVGRELMRSHRLLIAVNPTRGIDIGSVYLIHKAFLAAKKGGESILLISYELDEILTLADTVAVLYNGSIVKQLKNNTALTKEEITASMIGQT